MAQTLDTLSATLVYSHPGNIFLKKVSFASQWAGNSPDRNGTKDRKTQLGLLKLKVPRRGQLRWYTGNREVTEKGRSQGARRLTWPPSQFVQGASRLQMPATDGTRKLLLPPLPPPVAHSHLSEGAGPANTAEKG